nr:class I SAM-dependent methyltransferase [Roseococcus sp. MDT2-1-1]
MHARGLQATRELADLLGPPRAAERILDIGAGIGGPARSIAATFGCIVTGVELKPEYCAAAAALNAATGLAERVRVVEGNALALPSPDGDFDRAYSHNVVMCVADKLGFWREALRVLRPGGTLAVIAYAAGPKGPPHHPCPWAVEPSGTFLSAPEQTRTELEAAGFEVARLRDTTAEALLTLRKARRRVEQEGPPPLGLHVLVGPGMVQRQANAARSLEEVHLAIMEVLARRPA